MRLYTVRHPSTLHNMELLDVDTRCPQMASVIHLLQYASWMPPSPLKVLVLYWLPQHIIAVRNTTCLQDAASSKVTLQLLGSYLDRCLTYVCVEASPRTLLKHL